METLEIIFSFLDKSIYFAVLTMRFSVTTKFSVISHQSEMSVSNKCPYGFNI